MRRRQFTGTALAAAGALLAKTGWTAAVSDADAASGIRAALERGAGAAVDLLGRPDGFLGNPKVRIPLPGVMKDAAKGGMMEVAMGRVAEQNATDSEVKNFGARMVKDHSKANDELKALAREQNVQLPAEKEPGKWKSDKDYMGQMVKDHENDLAAFEKEAKEGSDPNVKNFASKTSEVVRKHLDMAKKIDSTLK